MLTDETVTLWDQETYDEGFEEFTDTPLYLLADEAAKPEYMKPTLTVFVHTQLYSVSAKHKVQ